MIVILDKRPYICIMFRNCHRKDIARSLKEKSGFLKNIPSSFLKTGPFRIHYLHAGTGEPLILIHGGGVWLYSFRHNIGPLSRYFSVYAVDMPGYGFTTVGKDTLMNNETMTRAIESFMDGMDIARASLLGHSWGGGWALEFAETHPDRVNKIILIDSSGLDVPDVFEWELMKLPVIGSFLLWVLTPGMIRKRLELSFSRKALVDDDMVREVLLNLGSPGNRKAQARLARNLSWKKTEERLRTLTHPVLLIWGDEDRYLSVNLAEQFQRRIKNIRIEIIRQCGHSPQEEAPDSVNRLVMDFLKQQFAD
jgi:pimeloyl-ACP methyl ester carboxylesterase